MTNTQTTPATKKLSSFCYAFQITKNIVFQVSYYRLRTNQYKYFTTSAAQFNKPKTDFKCGGQAQKELLKEARTAMRFYQKWDRLHIQDLNKKQHAEILNDLEELKATYNYIKLDNSPSFDDLKILSKAPIKPIRSTNK